jgi:hypothetical protein
MDMSNFMRHYGVTAAATHLIDYVTHTAPDVYGHVDETTARLWAAVFEHPDQKLGDQRVIAFPYVTDVGVSELDPVEVLDTLVAQGLDGSAAFEEYLLAHIRLPAPHSKHLVTAEVLKVCGAWHQAAAIYHQLHWWCSSEQMRNDLDMIGLDVTDESGTR